jgi:hypothetical protein
MQTLPLIQFSYLEMVLQRIYDILVLEELNQEAQAIILALNPQDFSWSNVLEEFTVISPDQELAIPLVNIWYSNSSYSGSNSPGNPSTEAVYNIDIYAPDIGK